MSEEAFNTKIAELQEQVNVLTGEIAQLRRERDWAYSLVTTGVPVATKEEELAFIREMQTRVEPGGLANLIAELEADNG